VAEIHAAAHGALTKALVDTVVEQLRDPGKVWYWTNQSAALHPNDPRKACEATLYEAWTDFDEHLAIPLAVTLATFSIDAEGNQTDG
jgi:hypothetical protein